jgi:uncharacterized cysteine cluster protein YcgN (CxxCxxCC family)
VNGPQQDASQSARRKRFWELPLDELNTAEWEQLCDGCGRCCLKKLEDPDSAELAWTRVICRYYDQQLEQCGCYQERTRLVPECLDVRRMELQENLHWMPATCAYRLRAEGKPLYDWHPLLAGSHDAMQAAGISVTGQVLSEDHVHPDGLDEHLIRWVTS